MSRHSRRMRILCLCATTLLMAGSALASEAGGHADGQLKDFLYRLLDFGITFGALYFLLRGPLKRALSARRQRVAEALEQARQMQASAERRFAACRQQLADADAQIAQLTADLKAESALQCQRIEEQARKMADDIRSEATRSAAREIEAARKQLHQEAVRLAMELAEQRLKQQIAPQDQARLVDEYLRKTGE
ncbi:ATP synthase F0, B subunit [Syntrophotalea carbinolica DSM 2380]|uniref:ATP synthase subunit b 1 n=1 Tax=Syntrophotalea carbinolica (strain DSM 2380 / NBRC 103641 / GraBd1) TaxID=338963 RepID=ATPF1_SYNC1|nr:ATP synthase F0 subunit B [Syntrophotalea carbinolica]Q39ZT7.1 RecName: Full=ATP synthase subunit b 1; AltName: Full=ATP synthase F(0) sector subunit b 1; AltName: Full=ATPase subunit I 1; AltName: Full=F-type ATPase subunit b 1; Short=F-ATPase subunit b 1 [Syntrophotalea carbinolica DSM 2380]ABA88198.1 ATP synthase F0, B subunit [Syntrophotalea carbinolica DSM 2380]ABA90370.1 ATP synthase F0, B subunit [Syntrophotalea carbinolica DSM 2380]